jgi:hypothetical protein
MRTHFLFACLATLSFACGGDGLSSSTTKGDAATSHDLNSDTDAGQPSVDLSSSSQDLAKSGVDLASADFAGTSCGTQTCSAGSVCCVGYDTASKSLTQMCVAGTTCADGGVTASCDGPEDCSGGSCCADIMLANNAPSGSSMCGSSCTANFSLGKNSDEVQTKLCHTPSDCTGFSGTGGNYDNCCTYPGLGYSFCAPSLVTLASNMITCTAP